MDIKEIANTNNAKDIVITVENGIQRVMFNRPKRKNAITISMYKQLTDCFYESAKNENVHALVLTGSGDFFSSGNDLMNMMISKSEFTNDTFNNLMIVFKDFVDAVITYPKLFIAVVNGPAIGIATTILGLVDIAYASNKAYFQTPFSKLGLRAEGCSTYTFPRIMGMSKAAEMLYLGHKISANEAKQCGLVSEVYRDKKIDDVWSLIYRISSLSLESIFGTKRLVKRWDTQILLEVNAKEVDELSQVFKSPDFIKRISYFFSKKSKM